MSVDINMSVHMMDLSGGQICRICEVHSSGTGHQMDLSWMTCRWVPPPSSKHMDLVTLMRGNWLGEVQANPHNHISEGHKICCLDASLWEPSLHVLFSMSGRSTITASNERSEDTPTPLEHLVNFQGWE